MTFFLKQETIILYGCHWIMQLLTSANYARKDNLSLELAHWMTLTKTVPNRLASHYTLRWSEEKSQGSEAESKLNGGTGLLQRRLHTKQVWTQAGWCVHPQSGTQRYIASNTPRYGTEPDWHQIISGFLCFLSYCTLWEFGETCKFTDLHRRRWEGRQSVEMTTNQGNLPHSRDKQLIVLHTN